MWDALEAQYGVSDVGSELYIMEQFLDYRMVEEHSVVEQAHEIHTLAKEQAHLNEVTSLDTATVEAEWLRELLIDLPIVEKLIPATLMNCDNQTVIC